MKKRKILIGIIILAILFVPFKVNVYKDGGSKSLGALTYKMVKWKVLSFSENDDGFYEKTRVYVFPNNFKGIDELWRMEKKN